MKDKINFYGYFSIKQLDKNGILIDFYEEKNLVMDTARANMAELIGGVSSAGDPINQFVIGTKGHMGTDILDYQQVGETDTSKPSGNQLFDATRTALFSEVIAASINYRIPFDASGIADITVNGSGTHYIAGVAGSTDAAVNTIRRVVADKTVTYTITIPVTNANDSSAVAYTEAGLYAGTELFAMKTFPARVKEDTSQFVITWSIIF
jgi:hypothetical protein